MFHQKILKIIFPITQHEYLFMTKTFMIKILNTYYVVYMYIILF